MKRPREQDDDSTEQADEGATAALCEVCHAVARKYCCPRCSMLTCSLACCTRHKMEHDCSGRRDRAAFISMADFTDAALRSDYRFLEDVTLSTDRARRGRAGAPRLTGGGGARVSSASRQNDRRNQAQRRRAGAEGAPATSLMTGAAAAVAPEGGAGDDEIEQEPSSARTPSARKLSAQALRYGTTLLLMPTGMSRQARNTSSFDPKQSTIRWRVELVFPSAPEGTVTLVQRAVDMRTSLSSVLRGHLAKEHGNLRTRRRLPRYTQAIASGDALEFFLPHVPCSADAPLYHRLDPDVDLATSLQDKTIIEFPTITIALPHEAGNYRCLVAPLVVPTDASKMDDEMIPNSRLRSLSLCDEDSKSDGKAD